jgi:hypothetical protein
MARHDYQDTRLVAMLEFVVLPADLSGPALAEKASYDLPRLGL